MKINILIGGKAGQGINKISEIVSKILVSYGYFIFNYRDYQSLIRGGHNFNILSLSDSWFASHESAIDVIVCLDSNTLSIHKNSLKKNSIIIDIDGFEAGKSLNITLAGALVKVLGIDKSLLIDEIKKEFKDKSYEEAVETGYKSQKNIFNLKKLNNKIKIINGNQGISIGAINSGIDINFFYPMTPATGVSNELAAEEIKKCRPIVFQSENEIAVINSALGASFAGKKVMVNTSGGGFDLMSEALSFQGQSEIPLVVYLASRPGPGTGIPTYTAQADLDIALRAGHGEFPRIVSAPGDPVECAELINQAFYLAEKFKALSIVLSDKHLAESEFSINKPIQKPLAVNISRKIPGSAIVKANSYEHNEKNETTESPELAKLNAEKRIEKYNQIKKECKKFQMIKIHGKKESKNLIIGWGSTKGAILDSIAGIDAKFLQVIYMKPLSGEIKAHMLSAKKIILIEQNVTGQLGRLIREKTGIKVPEENRILKYDGLPFTSGELKKEIERRLK